MRTWKQEKLRRSFIERKPISNTALRRMAHCLRKLAALKQSAYLISMLKTIALVFLSFCVKGCIAITGHSISNHLLNEVGNTGAD